MPTKDLRQLYGAEELFDADLPVQYGLLIVKKVVEPVCIGKGSGNSFDAIPEGNFRWTGRET